MSYPAPGYIVKEGYEDNYEFTGYLYVPAPAPALLTNLVSYWSFDGTSNTRADAPTYVGYDSHGPGYAGHTLYPSLHDGTRGGKLSNGHAAKNPVVPPYNWDSSLNYSAVLGGDIAAFQFAGDLTVSAWVRNSSNNTFTHAFVKFSTRWSISQQSPSQGSQFRAIVSSPSGDKTVDFMASAPTAGWHHVLFTYSGSTRLISTYYDGAFYASDTLPAARYTDGDTITVNGSSPYVIADNGIDECGIWSRVLESWEVAALFNSGSGLAYSSFTS